MQDSAKAKKVAEPIVLMLPAFDCETMPGTGFVSKTVQADKAPPRAPGTAAPQIHQTVVLPPDDEAEHLDVVASMGLAGLGGGNCGQQAPLPLMAEWGVFCGSMQRHLPPCYFARCSRVGVALWWPPGRALAHHCASVGRLLLLRVWKAAGATPLLCVAPSWACLGLSTPSPAGAG